MTDPRVIESTNVFEGQQFGPGRNALRHPATWRHLWNPFRPSWGEPYKDVTTRMMSAVGTPARRPGGHEAVIVSHQLPIWITRLHVEKRSFLHDPRRRQCTLCSLTSLHFVGDRLTQVSVLRAGRRPDPRAGPVGPFSAGGAPEEPTP